MNRRPGPRTEETGGIAAAARGLAAELAPLAARRLGALRRRAPAPPAEEARLGGRLHSLRRDRQVMRHHFDRVHRIAALLVCVLSLEERQQAREGRLARTLAGRSAPALLELLEDHPRRYNEAAFALEREADPALRDRLLQTAPRAREAVSRPETRPAVGVAGLQAGAERCARVLAAHPLVLHWQPRAYRTEIWYSEAPAWRPASPRAWGGGADG